MKRFSTRLLTATGVGVGVGSDGSGASNVAPVAAAVAESGEEAVQQHHRYSALLLGSPGETASTKAYTAKASRDGGRAGLQGVLRDLMLARAFLVDNDHGVFECLHGMRLFRGEVIGALTLFFMQDPAPEHFVIYFSGHGNPQTGNWALTDGELSLADIYDVFVANAPPDAACSIVADSCHSGAWVDQLRARSDDFDATRFAVQAACLKDEVCWDTRVGGLFTKNWVSGEYYRMAQAQVRRNRGRQQLEDLQQDVKQSIRNYLPWAGFLTNHPGVVACRLLTAAGMFTCASECQALSDRSRGLGDVERAQHPIASHPYAFNLTFYDARFGDMVEERRFPRKDGERSSTSRSCHFIDLNHFWLGTGKQ